MAAAAAQARPPRSQLQDLKFLLDWTHTPSALRIKTPPNSGRRFCDAACGAVQEVLAVVAQLDGAIQYPRALMMDRDALEYGPPDQVGW
jgi:hypothetical protein